MPPVEEFVPLKGGDVPLEDVRKMKRSGSHGSDKSLDVKDTGNQDSLDYRMQAVDIEGGKQISLWHDVSLVHLDHETKKETEYMNFVCEIPKFTRYVGSSSSSSNSFSGCRKNLPLPNLPLRSSEATPVYRL